VINSSSEPKVLPPGTYTDTTIDLTDFPGLGPLRPSTHSTTAYQVTTACRVRCFLIAAMVGVQCTAHVELNGGLAPVLVHCTVHYTMGLWWMCVRWHSTV
jgi:hypothetical protein